MSANNNDDLPPDLEDMSETLAAAAASATASVPGASKRTEPPISPSSFSNTKAISSSSTSLPSTSSSTTTTKKSVDKSLGDASLTAAIAEKIRAAATVKEVLSNKNDTSTGSSSSSQEGTGIEEEEEDSLQKQMMEVALASRKEAEKARAKEETKTTKEFMKGTAIKKGFLLSNDDDDDGDTEKKKNSSSKTKTSQKSTTTTTSSFSLSTKEDLPFIAKKSSSSSSSGENSGGVEKLTAEVKRSMGEVNEHLQNERSTWMTPEFMQTIATNPVMRVGMQNPRVQVAMSEFAKNPTAAMTKYKGDKLVEDVLTTFSGLMAQQFAKLGEEQDKKSGGRTSESSSSSSSGSSSSSTAKKPSSATVTSIEEIGMAPTSSRKLTEAEKLKEQADKAAAVRLNNMGILSPDSGVSSEEIANAAKNKTLPNADDEVRKVLSDRALIDILRDPIIMRIMEECRQDPSKLQRYMRDPDIQRKFFLLQKAGLIRFE